MAYGKQYKSPQDALNDPMVFSIFSLFQGLKELVMAFIMTYLIFHNYILGIYDTTVTSAVVFFVANAIAGDYIFILLGGPVLELFVIWGTMFLKDVSLTWKQVGHCLLAASYRMAMILFGTLFGLMWLSKQYGEATLEKAATTGFLWEDVPASSTTSTIKSNWSQNNFFLYVMFYTAIFNGAWVFYRHMINDVTYSFKFKMDNDQQQKIKPYSDQAAGANRIIGSFVLAALYFSILRVSNNNIGDPILAQIYLSLQWYSVSHFGYSVLIGAVVAGEFIVAALFVTKYWLVRTAASDKSSRGDYAPLPNGKSTI